MQRIARFNCSNLAAVVCAAILVALAVPASADTFHIQYFEATAGTADFYNGGFVPIGVSTNYVTSTLGPNGLPVFNPSFTASGTVLAPNSAYLNSVTNELEYWTVGAGPVGSTIKADGSGSVVLSAAPITMFPPGQSGDFPYEETAILTGFFTVAPATTDAVIFTVGADDTAFVYVNGSLVESLGGVHADTPAPSNTVTYGPGTYELEIFYADRATSDAELSFTDDGSFSIVPTNPTNPVTPGPVPEPSTLLLLSTGFVGLAGALRLRFS
jgi:fibro-slime domain-containing protein